jgi:hypothetical protein
MRVEPATSETQNSMKLAPWYFAAILPVAAAGCAGAFLGHFAVLLVVAGIFVGTLSLGRTPVAKLPLTIEKQIG